LFYHLKEIKNGVLVETKTPFFAIFYCAYHSLKLVFHTSTYTYTAPIQESNTFRTRPDFPTLVSYGWLADKSRSVLEQHTTVFECIAGTFLAAAGVRLFLARND
jgi:threonine/homoserine/homoserine lactone efflux protein